MAPPPGATPRHRLVADRVARWVATAGGGVVVASILGILVFLLAEVTPLFKPVRVEEGLRAPAGPGTEALLADPHRTHLATLGSDGIVRIRRTPEGTEVAALALVPEGSSVAAVAGDPRGYRLALALQDGRVVPAEVRFELRYEGDVRRVEPVILPGAPFVLDFADAVVVALAVGGEEGVLAVAVALSDDRIVVARRETQRNPLTDEETVQEQGLQLEAPARVRVLALAPGLADLVAAAHGRRLLWWDLRADPPDPPRLTRADAEIGALAFLIGGRALVVGRDDGALDVWHLARRGHSDGRLERARSFEGPGGAIAALATSDRDRSFAAATDAERFGLYYSTSERVLEEGPAPVPRVSALAFAPKGNVLYAAGDGAIASLALANPHPDVSLSALFGRVLYEGYERPEFVWQSSSGTDDFESKLSLVPLVLGTLKGTLYSLILALPLGILGALYTSQFLHPTIQRFVKPTVELMASIPSVVLGLLAALWLAPRLEHAVPALLLLLVWLPLGVLLAGGLWHSLPRRFTGRFPRGVEVAALAAGVALAGAVAWTLGDPLEARLFGGDFRGWLRESLGLVHDQRNALIVGIAMGFAVIPIIFAIAEDGFSNVPPSLVAGSLALGATRWQTTTRILLPAASPALFAAGMIGFGRAVGETMIVLMATGNTPILEWNPFNGFRTLSANIAVEIPEAPHGGTLYRTLFLSALLLFAITFVINTASELVRARLRARFPRE